jgi:hypothetical protein
VNSRTSFPPDSSFTAPAPPVGEVDAYGHVDNRKDISAF